MSQKTGLWIIGAYGGVATTVSIGLAALKRGLIGNWGLVSQHPQFAATQFVRWSEIVLGGHEIRQTDAVTEVKRLATQIPALNNLIEACTPELLEFDRNIVPGMMFQTGAVVEQLATPGFPHSFKSPRAAIDQIQLDLKQFVDRHQLKRLVVVNLASTEPPQNSAQFPQSWSELSRQLQSPDCPLPSSSLYAIAALELGFAYINFTPSLGSDLPAIEDLALQRGACHVGRDGKTGETFLKSVLAPAFANRNLEIMSWVGHNIIGNMDGVVLNDPVNKQNKIKSKDQLLGQILGYQPQTLVSIEYVPSLGDWKTAWDHIHFKGFLGTPMVMTFTWQGCDSILAAPLVLDLVRFTELAVRQGETGVLTFLSSFFKSPQRSAEHDFAGQFQQLCAWIEKQKSPTR